MKCAQTAGTKPTSCTMLSNCDLLPAKAFCNKGKLRTTLRRLSICVTRAEANLAELVTRASDEISFIGRSKSVISVVEED